MPPHLLFKALAKRSGKSVLDLAKEMDRETFQGTLSRFLAGLTPSPSRATAKRIAQYWGLPVETVYDPDLADKVATELELVIEYDLRPPEPYGVYSSDGHVVRESEPLPYMGRIPRDLYLRISRLTPDQWTVLQGVIEGYLASVEAAAIQSKAAGT